jgi:hypothetical protein
LWTLQSSSDALEALSLSITETVLIFAGIPLLVAAIVTGLVYGGKGSRERRYRPGRGYDFTPVWLLASPERVRPSARREALPSGTADGSWPPEQDTAPGSTGGTSDSW